MSLAFSTRRRSFDFAVRKQQLPVVSRPTHRLSTCRRLGPDNSSARSYRNTYSTQRGNETIAQTTVASATAETATAADKRAAFLQDANAQMKAYHQAREQMKQGKLPSINAHRGPQPNANTAQAVVVVVFVAAFFAMPFLGKTIATNDAFREKWVPSWYDFTVKKPEHAWTRQELHEQMLAVQQHVRERAIAGDFTPDKLQAMQQAMQHDQNQPLLPPHRSDVVDRRNIPKEWDMIHPGMEAGEKLDESDD